MILINCIYNSCTRVDMETWALWTEAEGHACFLSWDFVIYVCDNASGWQREYVQTYLLKLVLMSYCGFPYVYNA